MKNEIKPYTITIISSKISFMRKVVTPISNHFPIYSFNLFDRNELPDLENNVCDFIIIDFDLVEQKEKRIILSKLVELKFLIFIYVDNTAWIKVNQVDAIHINNQQTDDDFKKQLLSIIEEFTKNEKLVFENTNNLLPLELMVEEVTILKMLYDGKPEKAIASFLCISTRTYYRRQLSLAKKLGLENVKEMLIKFAVQNKLVE